MEKKVSNSFIMTVFIMTLCAGAFDVTIVAFANRTEVDSGRIHNSKHVM